MGKGEREREEIYTALQQGSKIPQSVLVEQIETITERGIFSLGIFSPLHSASSVMKCMNALTKVRECGDTTATAKSCLDVRCLLDHSWFYELHV